MLVFAIVDRALDVIGLCTVLWFTVKGTLWVTGRGRKKDPVPQRAVRLNRDQP